MQNNNAREWDVFMKGDDKAALRINTAANFNKLAHNFMPQAENKTKSRA